MRIVMRGKSKDLFLRMDWLMEDAKIKGSAMELRISILKS